jgi:hypothetical protein
MIPSHKMSAGRTLKFVSRGLVRGAMYALLWSALVGILNGPLLMLVYWAYTGHFSLSELSDFLTANLLEAIPLFVLSLVQHVGRMSFGGAIAQSGDAEWPW